jgi:polyferredoxin
LLALLVRKQKFTNKIGLLFLFISTGFGFLFFAPMIPYTFQLLILRDIKSLGVALPMATLGLVLILLLTFVFGRFFCGYVCPIGAVQELLSRLPIKQKRITNKKGIIIVHVFFFILFVLLGVMLSINMLNLFGIYDFFNLQISSIFIIVFILLMVVSIIVYRPFCRLVCPYGLLLSIASIKSIFQLKRNENCVDCGICEKKCPTDESLINSFKQECYLCMHCQKVCSEDGISYGHRRK